MKFFIKFFSIVLLLASITLLIFVFYRSEIYYLGEKHDFYFKYYVLSSGLIIISIILIFIKDKFKILLSCFLSLFIFSLYLVEIFLLLDSREFRIWKSGIEYDKRSEIQYYSDTKKKDKNVKMITPPVTFLQKKNLSIFPLSGISKKKTILCNEHGYNATYESDRYGFNNPDSEWNKNSIDFLLIGDSFTQGACVYRPHSIAGLLRKMNKTSGVITLGYMANGPLIEYATLREYIPVTKPKNVIWFYYENDLLDLKFELKNKILLKYLNQTEFTQNLINKQNQINRLAQSQLDYFENEYKNSVKNDNNYSIQKFIKLNKLRIFIKSLSNEEMVRKISPEFKKIIELAYNDIKKNNGNLYFVYIPEYKRYKKGLQNDYNFNDYEKVIKHIESLNIPIIDLNKELFSKNKDPLSFFPFRKRAAGFSPAVNSMITDIIYKKINQNN